MLTLYLRRELTTDPVINQHIGTVPQTARHDVVAYADAGATMRKARWSWFYSNRPTRRNRYVMFNCYRWRIVWLPAL